MHTLRRHAVGGFTPLDLTDYKERTCNHSISDRKWGLGRPAVLAYRDNRSVSTPQILIQAGFTSIPGRCDALTFRNRLQVPSLRCPTGPPVVSRLHLLMHELASLRLSTCWPGAARAMTLAISACLALTPIVAGSPVICQNFDGPDPIWQLDDDRCRLVSQERIPGGARSARGMERLVVAGPVAESARLLFSVPHLAVLDELEASVWVKAGRPDIQIAARVVMPRATQTDGRPALALVRGSTYNRPDHWQRLRLDNVPDALASEVRILRATPGARIDPRQAYVDAIVLIVPSEPKGTEILTDDLDVDGVLLPEAGESTGVQQTSFPAPAVPAANPSTISETATGQNATARIEIDDVASESSIRLHGSVLMVEGKPFMPRVIEWRDEPLEFLAQRGFNAIQLSTLPTSEQSTEAKRHGLWFLCPALRPDAIGDGPVGHPDDRVLAWLLDDPAIEIDPAYGRNWAALVRQHDTVRGRPIVVMPHGNWDAAANVADVIIAAHPRIGQMSPADFDRWLTGRMKLVQPGVPLWSAVASQFSDHVGEQANSLAETLGPPPIVNREQLLGFANAACVRGCRGIVVQSGSALNDDTPHAQQRAATLELLNRRLQLLEPWVASGKVVGQIESTNGVSIGIVLLVDRARILVPIAADVLASGAKSAGSADVIHLDAAFVVPGTPESCQVYWLSPASMRPLAAQRVAGGTRIVLPSRQAGMALLTEDPKVVQAFRQHVAQNALPAARLLRTLVEQEARRLDDQGRKLLQLGYANNSVLQKVSTAQHELRQFDALVASGRVETAYELAERIDRKVQFAADEQQRVIGLAGELLSHPLVLSHEQILDYGKFAESSIALRGGENLLYGGDFEDLGQMVQFGWQHVNHQLTDIESRVTLTAQSPKHGSYSLELHAKATGQLPSPLPVTSAPVWVVTHPIPVNPGQIIAITGWVRVDEAITDDGLEIVDSLGGPELALNVRKTAGWQPFQLLRAVPESTELRVTFALTGLGTAHVDGVMVRELEKPVARRLPVVSPLDSPIGPNTADKSGPLFIAPAAR
jgi:hypothetical protein